VGLPTLQAPAGKPAGVSVSGETQVPIAVAGVVIEGEVAIEVELVSGRPREVAGGNRDRVCRQGKSCNASDARAPILWAVDERIRERRQAALKGAKVAVQRQARINPAEQSPSGEGIGFVFRTAATVAGAPRPSLARRAHPFLDFRKGGLTGYCEVGIGIIFGRRAHGLPLIGCTGAAARNHDARCEVKCRAMLDKGLRASVTPRSWR